jgi:PAS domain S-box-containing protein
MWKSGRWGRVGHENPGHCPHGSPTVAGLFTELRRVNGVIKENVRWNLRAFWSPRLTALLVTSILLLIAMGFWASRSLATLKEGNAWLVHTENVRYEIGRGLQFLTDIETAERGFAVSADEQFLEPYRASLPQLPAVISSLKQLIADNPVQRLNVVRFEGFARARVEHARQVVELVKKGDVTAARALISGGEGKRRMDAARGVAAQMQAEETRLSELRGVASGEALHDTWVALWVSSGLAIFLLLVIAISAVRYGMQIRRGESILATTLRSVGDAVISTDAAGAVQFMNAVAENLTGWDERSACGRPLDEVFRIVNEETRELVESPVIKVLREGKIVGLANHTVLIARDGREHAIEDSGAPVVDAAKLIGVVLVFRDATAQRAAQRALLESEQRYRAAAQQFTDLADNVNQLVWMAEPDGSVFWYNKRWYEYTGTTLPQVLERWRGAIARGEPFDMVYPLKGADGEFRPFLTRIVPITDEAGRVSRWFGTNTDISEQRRAEELTKERERRFVGLANTIPQLAWTNRPDGTYEYFNRGWYTYTGLTEEQSLRPDVWERAVHPQDIKRMMEPWAHSLTTGNSYEIECRLRCGDGTYCWFLARANTDRDGDGHIIEWFGTCTDIDKTKRNEENLRQTEAALREADRRKDVFLATLSHELRNPLAPIRNAAKVLESDALTTAELERSRLIIGRQVRHMASLLDDLLDLSRITRGVFALKKEYVNLQGLLAEAVETARPVIDAKRHTLKLEWPEQPIEVEADPVRVVQIVANLLTNAAKYTDSEGHITLGARTDGGDVVIFVRDTGVGLAPEMLAQVFEMFSQVDANHERSEGGLGIGLALVKGLVDLHGGRVEARSAGLERGSEFVVVLPRLRVATGTFQQLLAERAAVSDMRATRRVLVADDNQDGAESLAMLLEMSGHEVFTAHTGSDALQLAAKHRPHIAILDIGMPGMSGYDVAQQIRREAWGGHMTLIAMTGWGQEDDKRRAHRAGFDHHVTKPVDPATLDELLAPPIRT